jgi:hypothetical protein
VILGLRKEGPPVCIWDVSQCTNEEDIRHVFLRDIAKLSKEGCENVRNFAKDRKKNINGKIVAFTAKSVRSANLAKFNNPAA